MWSCTVLINTFASHSTLYAMASRFLNYYPAPLQVLDWQNQTLVAIDFLLSVGDAPDTPVRVDPRLFQFESYFKRDKDCEVEITQLRFGRWISSDPSFTPELLQRAQVVTIKLLQCLLYSNRIERLRLHMIVQQF